MRYADCQKVLHAEHNRRGRHLGHKGQVTQLKLLTITLLLLYVACLLFSWRQPKPMSHVWVDEVEVEVLGDHWLDTLATFLFWALFISSGLLLIFVHCIGAGKTSHRFSIPEQHRCAFTEPGENGTGTEPSGEPLGLRPSIAISPRSSTAVGPHKTFDAKEANATIRAALDTTGRFPHPVWYSGTTMIPRHCLGQRLPTHRSPMTSISTPIELDQLLRLRVGCKGPEPSPEAGDCENAVLTPAMLGTSHNLNPIPTALRGFNEERSIDVLYDDSPGECTRAGANGMGAAGHAGRENFSLLHTFSDAEWLELGVRDLEQTVFRVREWVGEVCARLNSEIEECNQWLAAQELGSFDCNHSLQETLTVRPPPVSSNTTFTWSQPQSSQHQPPRQVPKEELLLSERQRFQQSAPHDLNIILRLNQRLALEKKLDITRTFPQANTSTSNYELAARQEYVVTRLRTLSKSRKLLCYKHNGGDADMWREGFPCDAHILVHVIRTSVEGMENYIRLGFQGNSHAQDLAICVGDIGEPYFYLRYRTYTIDRWLSSRPGVNSLFEAVLICAAIVHRYHRDVYGGIRGTLDLKRSGLINVLKE